MRRVTRVLTIAVAITCLLATSAVTAGAIASTKTKPAKWAATVCTSLGDWVTTIEAAGEKAAATAPTTPAAGKKSLVKLIGSAIGATKALVKKLKAAGVPAVDDGALVASTIGQQFKAVQSALTSARTTLKQIPADDPVAFVAQSRTAQDAIEAGLEGVQGALNAATNLDVAPLVEAFNAEPSCAAALNG